MTVIGKDPKENVVPDAGLGGYGLDFTPADRDFAAIKAKARQVMEGRSHYTFAEVEKIAARLVVDR